VQIYNGIVDSNAYGNNQSKLLLFATNHITMQTPEYSSLKPDPTKMNNWFRVATDNHVAIELPTKPI